MPNCGNRALDNKSIGPCLFCNLAEFGRALRNGADRGQRAAVFDLANPCRNQIFLDRLLINFLQQRRDFRFVRLDNFLQDLLGILVALLHPSQIEHPYSASLLIAMAKWTLTTPSIALARMGIFKTSG